MEDQRKETAPEQEGDKLKEPTGQGQGEEEEAGNPGELSDRRKEEPATASPEEPTDEPKEKEETEEVNSGELADRRKEAEAEAEKEKETERSSDQGSMEEEEDSSPFVHPCSRLLQYLVRACARCLGMPDSLDDDGGAAPAASLNSSREVRVAAVNKASGSTGFYMPERFTGVLVQLRRLQPGRNNPREGRGGNGGVHH